VGLNELYAKRPPEAGLSNVVLGVDTMIRRIFARQRTLLALPLALFALMSVHSAAVAQTKPFARRIDEAIDARLRTENVAASPRCDDAEFLRRVYLDLTGHIPSAEQAVAFLDSRAADKRAKLIDELLASADYGKHQADIWQALLMPRTSDNRFLPFNKMTAWLETRFNNNVPWDRLVRDILTAEGDLEKNGAVVYYLANAAPDKLTDNATRMFLGVQLQCAQCHNHPFTDWKQDAYWGMAAFFTKVRIVGAPRQVIRQGGTLAINENGKGRPIRLPISAKRVPPKFLQGDAPKVAAEGAYRPLLAEWMTDKKNPYFSRAMVNRLWAQLFGRGLVNPIDDMHDGNKASHPQLLADLSAEFAANGFDVKQFLRSVCNSETYQRTSKPVAGNRDAGAELFSRMAIKVLTPEQLYDSLTQILGAPNQANFQRRLGNAVQAAVRRNLTPRTLFVAFFKGDENAEATEYQAGIPQVLRMMNGPQMNNAALLTPLLQSGKTTEQIVEHLYLTVLSRRPTGHERERTLALLRKHVDEPRQAYGDILWVLLNSSEFTLNH
jgi:hypothetical protein